MTLPPSGDRVEPHRLTPVRAIMRILRERIRDERMVTPLVRDTALHLLHRYATAFPNSLGLAEKPGTWAAGAVHAAFMTIGGPGLTIHHLARSFEVSPASVAQRSRDLRRHWHRVPVTVKTAMIRWADRIRREELAREARQKRDVVAPAPNENIDIRQSSHNEPATTGRDLFMSGQGDLF